MKLVLLGTEHPLQEASPRLKPEVLNAFADHLRTICAAYGIAAIGEEMNLETVHEWVDRPPRGSIPEELAAELGILHKYCDPTQAERVALGAVSVETRRQVRALFDMPMLSHKELQAEQGIRYGRREEEWLRRILSLNTWPMLFICGMDHVPAFSNKVRDAGLDLEVWPFYPIPEGAALERPEA
jgi:hypothetical protein